MTAEEILKALQDCGCRRLPNESVDEWCERSRQLEGSYEGTWCDFDAPCPKLTREEIIDFTSKYGCICASSDIGLVVCEHCKDRVGCIA